MESTLTTDSRSEEEREADFEASETEESVWAAGSAFNTDALRPKYSNLKEEVLNNKYANITKRCWNHTLRKVQAIYKGETQSSAKKQWSQQLRDHHIGLKELIALKLYCDFDDLQCEFTKSFRFPYNQDRDRLSSFYWWNHTLCIAFDKFRKLDSLKTYDVLYHGVSSVMDISNFDGQCFGPLSTTTDIFVARSFAGKNGMILQIEPKYADQEADDAVRSANKPVDISLLSEFPEEHEVLCFNQQYSIKKVILSSSFDENHHRYVQPPAPSPSPSFSSQDTDIDTDDEVQICDEEVESAQCLKVLSQSVSLQRCIADRNLIEFLLAFIVSYNECERLTQHQSFVHSNIRYILQQEKQIKFDGNILREIMQENSCNIQQIKNVLSQYFQLIQVLFM